MSLARVLLCIAAAGLLGFIAYILACAQALTGAFTSLPSPEERLAEFQKYRPALVGFVQSHAVRSAKSSDIPTPPELHPISSSARVFGKPGHRQVELVVRSTFGWVQYYLWREDGKALTHLDERPIKNFYYVSVLPWTDGWYDVYMNNGH